MHSDRIRSSLEVNKNRSPYNRMSVHLSRQSPHRFQQLDQVRGPFTPHMGQRVQKASRSVAPTLYWFVIGVGTIVER